LHPAGNVFVSLFLMSLSTDPAPFLDAATANRVAALAGTPTFVYHLPSLEENARTVLSFPHPFGFTVRFAMKAAPNAAFLRLFHSMGLHIDASSGPEVHRALAAGIPPHEISLSSQELPEDFAHLWQQGIQINACSLRQLELLGEAHPGAGVGLRFNPGAGSGGTNRTNVGGPSSSFGIWHEFLPQVHDILNRHHLCPVRIHTHIGSGSDPAVWLKVASMTLGLVREFPGVGVMNLGGGFKVARVAGEKATDLLEVGEPVADLIANFATETGTRLHLEIEPGTFLLANAGGLLSRVQDVVDTGAEGYHFIKIDGGMTEVLRPSLYGAQHPIHLFSEGGPDVEPWPAVVVGHCCESGDILTPAPGEPEMLSPRLLPPARPGDLCWIGGAGAYCSAMATKNYNSFPEAPEVLLDANGTPHLIRQRQPLEQIWANELPF
jgi:diaminopimelate decarboxylase